MTSCCRQDSCWPYDCDSNHILPFPPPHTPLPPGPQAYFAAKLAIGDAEEVKIQAPQGPSCPGGVQTRLESPTARILTWSGRADQRMAISSPVRDTGISRRQPKCLASRFLVLARGDMIVFPTNMASAWEERSRSHTSKRHLNESA